MGSTIGLLIAAAVLTTFFVVLRWYAYRRESANDTVRYLAAGEGKTVMMPWHLRWLIPFLAKNNERTWTAISYASLILSGVCLAGILSVLGLSDDRILFGVLLYTGLNGVFLFNITHPILVDAPAMLFMLVSALLTFTGHPYFAVVAIIIGACIKETTPLFAAAFTLNPWLLLGLIAPLARYLFWKSASDDIIYKTTEYKPNRWFKHGTKELFRLDMAILPWGVALFLALLAPSVSLFLMLGLAYAQILIASDRMRLYQWAFPAVILAAVLAVPSWLILPLAVLHIFNPWGYLLPN